MQIADIVMTTIHSTISLLIGRNKYHTNFFFWWLFAAQLVASRSTLVCRGTQVLGHPDIEKVCREQQLTGLSSAAWMRVAVSVRASSSRRNNPSSWSVTRTRLIDDLRRCSAPIGRYSLRKDRLPPSGGDKYLLCTAELSDIIFKIYHETKAMKS